MVDAIVSGAIGKLGEFIAQEVTIRIGVRDGVRWLKKELGYLKASVRNAESRQEEELIREWLNDVRDVANDAVTILDRYSALQQEQAAQKQGILDRVRGCVCMFKKEVVLFDIGNEIESLKGRIDDIKKRRVDYRIDDILATPNVQQKQRTLLRTTAIDNQVDVVGFEDDIKTLMAELDSENLSLKVISIHGMGGLGKTSLATKLYNSSELRHFDTRAKVCVSNEYNIKDVLKRIVKSFKGPEHEKDMSTMEEHDLLQYLSKLLQDRGRYLALIDDIWDVKVWELIKTAFPDQKNGSRVIITTRNKTVAKMVDDKCFVHQLRFLTEDESWQLFCKRAVPTTQNMEILGREMVGKCRGLPLAIVVLSGLLLHNMNYDYWFKVKEHIWRHVKEGDYFQIGEILSLSYNDMSPQMRDCFLYLARYPEDDMILTAELKLLWIAEEFISEAKEGEVMEELAEDYLNELINRNLLQVNYMQLNGQVCICGVHDLVRDLAVNKAKEQKLLVTFDSGKHHPDPVHLLEGQPRHVIYNGIGEYLKLLERRFDALRSLALVEYFRGKVELKEMKLVCTRFKILKVLDMRSVDSERIPEEIGNLVLLKFLGLMGGETYSSIPIEIPPSIGKLKKLQTLLGSDQRRYTVPSEICKLHELRYIDIKVSGSLNMGDHQTKLHTLRFFMEFKEWMKIDTVNITNLHTLRIDDTREWEEGQEESEEGQEESEEEQEEVEESEEEQEEVEEGQEESEEEQEESEEEQEEVEESEEEQEEVEEGQEESEEEQEEVEGQEDVEEGNGYTLESIAKLTSLQILRLFFDSTVIPTMKPLSSCNRLKSVRLSGTLKNISELYFLPDSVTVLSLYGSKFTEDPMPTLGNLSNLTALELDQVYRGNKMVCSQNAFPSLQILILKYFPYLEELEVKDGAFPSLKQYRTDGCENLEKIPIQLERIWVPYSYENFLYF